MKTAKRVLLALVFVLLCVGLLSLSAFAAEEVAGGSCGENLTWVLDDSGTLTISGTGDMPLFDKITPWSGYADLIQTAVVETGVTSIGDSAFSYLPNLSSVSIPSSVTTIGSTAFSYCPSLTSIVIPSGTTEVSAQVFYGCTSLTSVFIPDSLFYIDTTAFDNCPSLTQIAVDSNNTTYSSDASGVLFNKDKTELLRVPGGFSGSYDIPSGVYVISYGAFQNCTGLTSVTIPASVSDISSYVFSGCDSLTQITLDPSNPYLSLDDSFVLYDKEKTMLLQVFKTLVGHYTVPEGVTHINSNAFCDCVALDSITLPESLTQIGESAFLNCLNLTSISIPGSVTDIGAHAFSSCFSLTSVLLPEGLTRIKESTFLNCANLTSITIPANVTSIGDFAFNSCSKLSSLVIPGSVTSLGHCAFSQCDGLTSVSISDGLISIGGSAFSNCGNLASVTLPDTLTDIGSYAFFECPSLTAVTLPKGLTSISHGAFSYCSSLASITIPSGVTYIGSWAFEECRSLTVIVFEGNAPSSGTEVFGNVTATAYCPANSTGWTPDLRQTMGGNLTWVVLGQLQGLEVTGIPAYAVGDTAQATDLTVYGVYDNGATVKLEPDEYTLSDCDMSTPGRKSATVTYQGLTAEIFLPVHEIAQAVTQPAPEDYPESAHDYGNALNETQTLTIPGAGSITLTFSQETLFEGGCDYLTILDGNDYPIANYTGDQASGVTVTVPGDTVKLRLETDGSVTYYGYSFANIVAAPGLIHPGQPLAGTAPTCTEDGKTDGIFCQICQAGAEQAPIPALGHDYISVVTPATPEANGYTTHTCSRCGDSYTDNETIYGVIDFGTCGEALTWMLYENGNLVISGTGEMYDAPWRNYSESVKTALIKEGATTICSWAFDYCSSLSSITIPDSVTLIGQYAFGNCSSLSSLTIPASVTSIDQAAFYGCTELQVLRFLGNAPAIPLEGADAPVFADVSATVYYPGSATGWTEELKQNFGGNITWTPLGVLQELNVTNIPAYAVGGSVRPSDFTVYGIYDNGVSLKLDPDEYIVTNYNLSAPGRLPATIICQDISAEVLLPVHQLAQDVTQPAPEDYPESAHDYGNALNETQTLTVPGAGSITLTFSASTQFEWDYDYLYVLDGNDQEIARYTGNEASGLTVTVPGDTVKLRLETDGSATYYGYSFTSIVAAPGLIHTGEPLKGTAPTCTEDGKTDGIFCQICQAGAEQATIPALGHDYVSVVTPATPDANGYITHTCSRCGDSYTDSETIFVELASGTCGNDLIWHLSEDGQLVISGTGPMDEFVTSDEDTLHVSVPWGEYQSDIIRVFIEPGVTSISDYAFMDCKDLEYISIPQGVTAIGDFAFANCPCLTDIGIPNTVTSIGNSAFNHCGLTSITIPDSVTEIGENALLECAGLKAITVDANNSNYSSDDFGVLFNKDKTLLIQAPCGLSGNYTVPDSVTTIDAQAFYHCTMLTSVFIPGSVRAIGSHAFYNCPNMKDVTISEGVTTIGVFAFTSSGLTSVVIPDSVTAIEQGAFFSCMNLSSVTLGKGLTYISDELFSSCWNLNAVAIPDGVTGIGIRAFYGCENLRSVDIPGSVTSISNEAFWNCNSLESIVIPASVEFIGYAAFGGEGNFLAQIIFMGDAPAFADDAFYNSFLTAYYDGSNPTWTEDVRQNYGGNVAWKEIGQLEKLEVTGIPFYLVGDTLDPADFTVMAVYSSGASIRLKPDEFLMTDCDLSSTGRKTVTVSYQGISADVGLPIHSGRENLLLNPSAYPESQHAYPNNAYDTQVLTIPGVNSFILTFSPETRFEESCDFLYVYDANENVIATYTGSEASGVTLIVPGDTVKLLLETDGSVTYYGYSFTSIAVDVVIHVGETVTGKLPTCTEGGISDGVFCEICQAVTGQYPLRALGHDYDTVVTPATPDANGYTTYACTRCGDSYVGSETIYGAIASGVCGDRLSWNLLEDGTLLITGTGHMWDFESVSFTPWSNYYGEIQNIVISEGVTSVGNFAFDGYCQTASVTLPSTLTRVGTWAFQNCSGLETVVIPACLVDIGYGAFRNCANNTAFWVDAANPYYSSDSFGVLFNKDMTEVIQVPCAMTGSYTIPSTVIAVGSYAFCSGKLTSVTIPSSMEHIGYGAFYECPDLTEILFEGDAPWFDNDVFWGVTATAYYPAGNATWTEYKLQNYGGNITWATYSNVTLPTVTAPGRGLAFKDEIYYNVYFFIDNPDDLEILEMGLITWTSAIDGDITNAEYICPGAAPESNYFKTRSQAIAAKNMGEQLYYKVYLKLADGTYVYSDLKNYSAKDYCLNMLGKDTTAPAVKSLCVALMNYGAAAQEYFGYKTDDLMNAGLTAEQLALAEAYGEHMIPARIGAGDKGAALADNGGFQGKAPSVNFGGAFGIKYNFLPANPVEGEMKLYVWSAADFASAERLTLENASQVISATAGSGGIYTATVSGIAAKDAGATVYVCAVYESNGTTYYSGVLDYSVSAYCGRYAVKDGDPFQPLAASAAIYTYYADAYLNG